MSTAGGAATPGLGEHPALLLCLHVLTQERAKWLQLSPSLSLLQVPTSPPLKRLRGARGGLRSRGPRGEASVPPWRRAGHLGSPGTPTQAQPHQELRTRDPAPPQQGEGPAAPHCLTSAPECSESKLADNLFSTNMHFTGENAHISNCVVPADLPGPWVTWGTCVTHPQGRAKAGCWASGH